MKRLFAILLVIIGLGLAAFGAWRGFYYAPNDEAASVVPALVNAAATSSPSSLPARLEIPRLGIDATVQRLGLTRKGNMAAPDNFTDVSWYKYGTVPGQVGSAVMAGHEDNAAALDGVFKHLDELEPGDDVYVVDQDGSKLHFQVSETKVVPYNLSGSELDKIFNGKDGARLNLITCTGHWVEAIKTNNERLVVFAKLVK